MVTKNNNKLILVGIVLFLSIMVAGCVEKWENETVVGTVIDMEYDKPSSYTKTVKRADGTSYRKRVTEAAEWEVTVKYNDIVKEFEFANDDFFKTVNVGDEVTMELRSGYDKGGSTVTQILDVPDEFK